MNIILEKIDTILFDLDGTLIDSAPDMSAAVNATMRELDKPEHSLEQITQWVGNGSKMLLTRALAGKFDAEIDEQTLKGILPLFFQHYRENLCTSSQIYNGVLPALLELQKIGIKMACVTNKPIQFAEPVLAKLQLDQFMPVIVGGGSLPQLKPDPEPLFFACELLGINEKVRNQTVLMVGDSSSDMKAAKAAGMQSIAVDYGYSQGANLLELGALKMISDMRELPALLNASMGILNY